MVYFILELLLERLGVGPYVSLTIAYAIATTYHFLMNRHFTFRSGSVDGGIMAALPRYFVVLILNYVITVVVVQTVMSAGFRIQVGMVAAIVLTTILTYVVAKAWIFK